MSSFTAAMRVSPRAVGVNGMRQRRRWDAKPALLFDKLGQHPAARFGMDKGDAPTMRPDARRRIYQANPGRLQLMQGGDEVRHGVRHMMHSLAPLGEITGDRTIRVRWPNQLDPARSG